MAYNPNIPSSGQPLGFTRNPSRINFSELQDFVNRNHVDIDTVGQQGKHKYLQFPTIDSLAISPPATNTDEIAVYSKVVGGISTLWMRQQNSGDNIQLTSIDYFIQAGSGYTFLPGGMILIWGTKVQKNPINTFSITFPNSLSLSSNIYSVQINSQIKDLNFYVQNFLPNGFSGIINQLPTPYVFSYIAIGKK